MDKKHNKGKNLVAEERWMKEIDFSFEQVNDYPLSDKTLVVSPQAIPLSADELPPTKIKDI